MAIATQTDCEAGTQTDPISARPVRRRARSENDDSMSDEEYEYVRYSPPNSPEGVYWIKRKKHRRRGKYKPTDKPRRRVVMVEEVKRKIRTPIKEESEDPPSQSPSKSETRISIMKRVKDGVTPSRSINSTRSHGLNKQVLMEISDSFDDQLSPEMENNRKHIHKISSHRRVEYYEEESDNNVDSDNDIVIRRNHYSADSLEDEYSDYEDNHHLKRRSNRIFSRQGPSIVSTEQHGDGRYVSSVTSTPAFKQRVSRKDSSSDRQKQRRQTASEPPHRSSKGPAPKPPSDGNSLKKTSIRSEADLVRRVGEGGLEISKSVPRYMEWYYNKSKDSDLEKKRLDEYRNEKEKSKVGAKKMVGGIEKRTKSKASRQDESYSKPEPMPRTSPPKGARMLKEDVQMNKTLAPKIQTDTNHPLLQYSEHRYEHEYNPAPDIPVAPTKLPHYMYPETPPLASMQDKGKKQQTPRTKPSPIHEHEIKDSSRIDVGQTQSKQLNASTLEDDHDSGIAMNTLLHSLGKRNPIADKKSVFTIAYDDVKVKKIQSESDSPQFS